MNEFLTQIEAAKVLRISPRTLERSRVDGSGPSFVKAGRRVLYRRADIDSWAAERTFRSTSEAQAAA
jgi:predicted DNA-binding transcriptional regulator AlpA